VLDCGFGAAAGAVVSGFSSDKGNLRPPL
jgi:hypothetical protein